MIRLAKPGDYDALGRVMFDAIHAEPSPYTPAQRRAWNAAPYQGLDWHRKLAAQFVVVAEDISGFMTMRPDGYIDLSFILPAARGTGLFRALFQWVESQARATGLSMIWTHASLTAQPAFAAVGFSVVRHEVVERDGQPLPRVEMQKLIG